MPALLTTIARALRWHRRLVAAACAAVAVYAVLTVVSAPEGDTRVVIAARGIAGGSMVEAADVTTLLLPARAVPDGALVTASQALGKTVVAPVPARGVLTTSDLVSAGAVVEEGRVALPVSFDPSAPVGLLRTGDTIDLIGTGDGGGQVVAERVRVAALPDTATGGLLGGGGGPVVLVDLTPEQAATVTAAARRSPLAFALR